MNTKEINVSLTIKLKIDVPESMSEREIKDNICSNFESVFNHSGDEGRRISHYELESVEVMDNMEALLKEPGWVKAVYQVSEADKQTVLLENFKQKNGQADLGQVEKMVVKDESGQWKEIEPVQTYTFEKSGENTVYIRFRDITEIPVFAFYGCMALKEIELPGTVHSIGESAFRDCKKMEFIYIPDSVDTIGESAFSCCRMLKGVLIPDCLKVIQDYTFFGCCSIGEITIPQSVTEIGDGAFMKCRKLKKINIPHTVRKIGETLFSGCLQLSSIVIEAPITKIGSSFASRCGNLKNLVLPDTLQEIGRYSFSECRSLDKIILPAALSKISVWAFGDDGLPFDTTSLAKVAPAIDGDRFPNRLSVGALRIPEGSTGYDTWIEALGTRWVLEYTKQES